VPGHNTKLREVSAETKRRMSIAQKEAWANPERNRPPSIGGRVLAILQAQNTRLLALLREAREWVDSVRDDSPCWYDHHGLCQGHTLHEKPCPHEQAPDLLTRIDAEIGEPDA
jgi:hypothetical protein